MVFVRRSIFHTQPGLLRSRRRAVTVQQNAPETVSTVVASRSALHPLTNLTLTRCTVLADTLNGARHEHQPAFQFTATQPYPPLFAAQEEWAVRPSGFDCS